MNTDRRRDAIGRDRREQIFVAMGRLSPYLCPLRLVSFLHCERLAAVNILRY